MHGYEDTDIHLDSAFSYLILARNDRVQHRKKKNVRAKVSFYPGNHTDAYILAILTQLTYTEVLA